ncbi:MAG: hypothetical protein L0312_26665 [Acidobacteria bacterium]|nr:hypothetical protein [Acidobacteriota bacterium]
MSPALAFLIAELVKLAVQRVSEQGKFNNLTEEEARAMAKQIGDALSVSLPTPEELASSG